MEEGRGEGAAGRGGRRELCTAGTLLPASQTPQLTPSRAHTDPASQVRALPALCFPKQLQGFAKVSAGSCRK